MRMLRTLHSCAWPEALKQALLREACRDLSFRVCATVSRAAAEWQHHISAAQLWQGLDRWRQLALLLQELSDCPSGVIAGMRCTAVKCTSAGVQLAACNAHVHACMRQLRSRMRCNSSYNCWLPRSNNGCRPRLPKPAHAAGMHAAPAHLVVLFAAEQVRMDPEVDRLTARHPKTCSFLMRTAGQGVIATGPVRVAGWGQAA